MNFDCLQWIAVAKSGAIVVNALVNINNTQVCS